MRICIDLDGTICETKKEGQHYKDVRPKPGAIEAITKLKNDGHEIIISTARHMKTCENSVGKVVARQGKTLFDWLEKHKIPYDEIWFGKVLANFYIDDSAIRFENDWQETYNTINKLIEDGKENKF